MDIIHYAELGLLPLGVAIARAKPLLEWLGKVTESREHREAAKRQAEAQVEAAKAAAAGVVEAAKVTAEVTGKHDAIGAWQAYADTLTKERAADRARVRAVERRLDECESKHEDCERKQADSQKQLRDWEDQAARMELQSKKERREYEARISQLESEMSQMRKKTPPTGQPAVR